MLPRALIRFFGAALLGAAASGCRAHGQPCPSVAVPPPGGAPSAEPGGGPWFSGASLVDAGAPASAPAPLPLPKGTTVLQIGDSFAGALGVALNAEFKANGVRGILYHHDASFIPTWAFDKRLPLFLAQFKPDLVLVTLGGNEVQIVDPERRAPLVRRLVERLEGRPCVWITPPLWGAGDTGLLPMIRANCAPCRYMDSNALYPDMPRLKDKVHPTFNARTEWAKRVVAWLQQERRPTPEKPWALAPE